MRHVFVAVIAAGLLLVTPALAQSFSGTSGVDSTGAVGTAPAPAPMVPQYQPPAAVPTTPATLPPVFQGANAGAAPVQPVVPTVPVQPMVPTAPNGVMAPAAGGLDANALPPDPCAAYLNSYDAYAICQDRTQRLQRMKDARSKRAADNEAARAKAAERRAARSAPAPETPARRGIQRPGQVPAAAPAPLAVQVVPAPAPTAAP